MRRSHLAPLVAALALLTLLVAVPIAGATGGGFSPSLSWTKVYGDDPSGWTGRAGLQAVQLRGDFYVMGGRTPDPTQFNPFGSILWNDVWKSSDLGHSWRALGTAPWAARGYFQAVTKDGAMYVLGGQNLSAGPGQPSQFFNDVWKSYDGKNWTQLTPSAPWKGRAGLSAIVFGDYIYVMGGSNGDDVAIGGSGRELFNDVWRSCDGKSWQQVTADAAWSPRAGAAVVKKDGYLYLLGGEDGFLCTVGPAGLQCPYFNDVWRSRNGAAWELVTPSAAWSPRPGHQAQVLYGVHRRVRWLRLAVARRSDAAARTHQPVPRRPSDRPVVEPRRQELDPAPGQPVERVQRRGHQVRLRLAHGQDRPLRAAPVDLHVRRRP